MLNPISEDARKGLRTLAEVMLDDVTGMEKSSYMKTLALFSSMSEDHRDAFLAAVGQAVMETGRPVNMRRVRYLASLGVDLLSVGTLSACLSLLRFPTTEPDDVLRGAEVLSEILNRGTDDPRIKIHTEATVSAIQAQVDPIPYIQSLVETDGARWEAMEPKSLREG